MKVKNLQFDDTGVYWVGIDKIYADIMTDVRVVVTEGMCDGSSTLATIFFILNSPICIWIHFVSSSV